jgi:hypothetical protein
MLRIQRRTWPEAVIGASFSAGLGALRAGLASNCPGRAARMHNDAQTAITAGGADRRA